MTSAQRDPRPDGTKPNVLLISIEDLNDYVEPLGGHPDVITPNISRLAEMGTTFTNTFASAPACSPARTAVLFGKMPWQTGVYSNDQKWFDAIDPAKAQSLVGVMRQNGYATFGAGKIFYAGIIREDWTTYFRERQDTHEAVSIVKKESLIKNDNIDYGPVPDDTALYDERNTSHIIEQMKRGAAGQLWSLGIFRPHLPFLAPKRFFDMYPEVVSNAPALKERTFDPFSEAELEGLPREAKNRVIGNALIGKGLHQSQQYNAFLRAYLASVTYADSLLGRVLDRLEDEGLAASTFIILWSDHGFHFGEKNHFRKFSLWERSLRTPMIFAGPGIGQRKVAQPVSNVDLGPTLLDLLGLESGAFDAGQSLRAVLHDGTTETLPPVVSVHAVPRKAPKVKAAKGDYALAWSVRSHTHRLIVYWNHGIELYDHRKDPFEHNNLIPDGDRRNIPNDLKGIVDDLTKHIPEDPAEVPPSSKIGANLPTEEKTYPFWARYVT